MQREMEEDGLQNTNSKPVLVLPSGNSTSTSGPFSQDKKNAKKKGKKKLNGKNVHISSCTETAKY
jgi:hypothetical protein